MYTNKIFGNYYCMKRFFGLLFLFFICVSAILPIYNIYGLSTCDIGGYKAYFVATYLDLDFEKLLQVDSLKIYTLDSVLDVDGDVDCVAEMLIYDYEIFNCLEYFKSLPCVRTESVEGITFNYLYDRSLIKILSIGNVKFNLQIAFCADCVKVGYPCIVGAI